MDWIIANKEWVFSGFGVAAAMWIMSVFQKGKKDGGGASNSISTVTINNGPMQLSSPGEEPVSTGSAAVKGLANFKEEVRILFIDDDVRFKVAKILVKSGWMYTRVIKDAGTLEDPEILEADILFIDVQGVGVALGFQDEGLGLALAIKEKYPQKKVVIYSAETQGNRFHSALRKADSFLSKNADPYEFQRIVEEFTIGGVEK